MKSGIGSAGCRRREGRFPIPMIAVCCVLLVLIDGVSSGCETVVDADSGLKSTVLSRIQTTLERGDLEGFLALSVRPPVQQLEVLRNFFGDPRSPRLVWDAGEGDREISEATEGLEDGLPAPSSGDRSKGSGVSLHWRHGVATPAGGRICVRSLALDGVYPFRVQRSLEETGVTIAQYGLLFQDERLKQVRFRSKVSGECEGRGYRLILVLINGEWKVIPGSILEPAIEQVQVKEDSAESSVSLDDFFPRSCGLAWHLTSSETCTSIDSLLRECGFRWGNGSEVLAPYRRPTDRGAMFDAMDNKLREISCSVRNRQRREDAIGVVGRESAIPHFVVPGASGEGRGGPKGDGLDVSAGADEKASCVMGYDVGSCIFLDPTVAQVDLFVALKEIGAAECHVEHWVVLWIRSGDEWLAI